MGQESAEWFSNIWFEMCWPKKGQDQTHEEEYGVLGKGTARGSGVVFRAFFLFSSLKRKKKPEIKLT